MRKILSFAAIIAAVTGIVFACINIFKSKKSQSNIDDLIYSDDFDEYGDGEDRSYFDVHMQDDEGVNIKSEEEL